MAPDDAVKLDRLAGKLEPTAVSERVTHEKPASVENRHLSNKSTVSHTCEMQARGAEGEQTRCIVGKYEQKINKYGACDATKTTTTTAAVQQEKRATRALTDSFKDKEWSSLQGASGGGGKSLPAARVAKKTHFSEEEESQQVESGGSDGEDKAPKRTRLERVAKCVPGLGIIMSLCASLFLGTAGMLVKLTTSVHGIEVAVLRAAIQLIIYSAIIAGRGIGWLPKRGEILPVLTRASLGGLSITLSYSALKLIPLGDATTIRFSLPIWTLIMSYFFLRESCSSFKIFAVIISISGVVLVTKPDMCVMLFHRLLSALCLESSDELALHERAYEQARVQELAALLEEAPLGASDGAPPALVSAVREFNQTSPIVALQSSSHQPLTYSPDAMRQFEGCLMALGSSICLSVSIIALRMCKQTPSEISIFWLSTISIVVGTLTLVAMDEWSVPDNARDWLYILLNGVCGSLGQWFMTNALKVEQSGVIALARTFDIEVAFLYSALLLGEEIRLTSIFGSVLVSLGVVSVVVPKWLGCGGGNTADEDDEPSQLNDNLSDSTSVDESSSSNGLDQHHQPVRGQHTTGGVYLIGSPAGSINQRATHHQHDYPTHPSGR